MSVTLRSLFLSLKDSGSPEAQDLLLLQLLLDQESLRHWNDGPSYPRPMRSNSDLVKNIALYLSGPLFQVEGVESSECRIQQLRAFVASLALLHHMGIKELHNDPYRQLRLNILDRFTDIGYGRRRSTTTPAQKHLHISALYLIRLAAQYFSLFQRSGNTAEALIAPVLGLALTGASIASGQYNNLQNVFVYIDEIITAIPRARRKDITLPSLQEITRINVTASTTRDPTQSADVESNSLEASELLHEALQTRIDGTASTCNSQRDWPWRVIGRVPCLSKQFFAYGILDCAVQLSEGVGVSLTSQSLQNAVQRIVYESRDEHLRWKAIEFFLCPPSTRRMQLDFLKAGARSYSEGVRHQVFDDAQAVYDHMEEINPHEVSEQPSSVRLSEEHQNLSLTTAETTNSSEIRNVDESIHTMHENLVEHMMPGQEHRKFRIKLRKKFTNAGISTDCKFLYFYNEVRLTVHETMSSLDPSARKLNTSTHEIIGPKDGPKHANIDRVALVGQWLAVSTNQELKVYNLESYSKTTSRVHTWTYGDWEPIGLALYDNAFNLSIVIGQRSRSGNSFEGRVLVFQISHPINLGPSLPEPCIFSLEAKDVPTDVDISPDGSLIICRTQLRNTVLLWELLPRLEPNQRRCMVMADRHTPETGISGLTSNSIYTSCSGNRYLFGMTYASTERFRNGGEWPFCSPIVFAPSHTPRQCVHNLEPLGSKRSLVAAAVSSQANVLAVLEANGDISIFALKAHGEGGICLVERELMIIESGLKSSQRSQSSICPSSLRFDTSGTQLLGVGPDGKVVLVTFDNPQHGSSFRG